MSAYYLDPGLVDTYCAGDGRSEGELAEQVARILPFRGQLPNPTAGALTRLTECLGGEERLLPWLAGHPGVPRIVTAVYPLVGLLDRISDAPAVVAKLPELWERDALPALLEAHLVPAPIDPDTTAETLASLAGQVETLLREEQYRAAVELASAAVDGLLLLVVSEPGTRAEVERIREQLDTALEA